MPQAEISLTEARRLALARAGLLQPKLTSLPATARGGGPSARAAAHAIIDRFGYLQLDTVSIAGARSHGLVLLSRLPGLAPDLPEQLLQPGEPLFEYWGHEASWLPIGLYPVFEFRRQAFRHHPWWGDVIGQNRDLADRLLRQITDHGPLRAVDMEGKGSTGWWGLNTARKVASAFWSSGELAIRERHGFQRTYDLSERVIPHHHRSKSWPRDRALRELVRKALDGHGWASTTTIVQTWRLTRLRTQIEHALKELVAAGEVMACGLVTDDDRQLSGWIRPADRDLASQLTRLRPRRDVGVLLSPFDPVLWDRARVKLLFGFDQVLEIYKPAPQRVYGYYCLPVLAGDRLVARLDLKAERPMGRLRVLACHFEPQHAGGVAREATRSALQRYADHLGLDPIGL